MKWYWKVSIAVGILVVGMLVYETISSRLNVRNLNSTIESYVSANAELTRRLTADQNRIVELQGIIGELESTSDNLRAELERIKGIVNDLDFENKRLIEILGRSDSAAGSIADESRAIGESIDNALDIIRRLQESYPGE